jgi:methylmalonyl-CoA mutase N-terminal domain/subunit
MEIESGERPVVGVNVHVDADGGALRIGQPDSAALERQQVERLGAMRRSRDARSAEATLGAVRAAAVGETNLVPPLIEAVKAGVTLGEISDALRTEWGTYDG